MQRPTGVKILAVLVFLVTAIAVISGVVFLVWPDFVKDRMEEYPAVGFETFAAIGGLTLLVMALFFGLIGYGLWRSRNWARMLILILVVPGAIGQALFAVAALAQFSLLAVVENAFLTGIQGLIVWYLLQPEVKRAFDGSAGSRVAATR